VSLGTSGASIDFINGTGSSQPITVGNALIPGSNNSYNLGSTSYYWSNCYINSVTANYISSNLIPGVNNTYAIGNSGYRWTNVYSYALNVAGSSNCETILPITTGTYNLGSASYFWQNMFTNYMYIGGTGACYVTNVGGSNMVVYGSDWVCSANCRPLNTNSGYCGTSGNTWLQGYAYNGWTTTSDAKEKLNLVDNDLGLDFVMQLKPKKWNWKKFVDEKDERATDYHYGLVYQDIDKLDKDNNFGFLCPSEEYKDTETGETKMSNNGLTYSQLIAPLISAIQEQQKMIEKLSARIRVLEKKK